MPIYEFTCQECGNEFERIQGWSETGTPLCSKCESANVVRLLSPPAIHFKGSGWYITDSKNGKNSSKNGKAGEKKTASDSGSNNGAGKEKAGTESTASSETKTSGASKETSKTKSKAAE